MNNLKVLENELVPVYETDTGEKVVYGSELHKVLEVKTLYKDWSTRRLSDVDAIENEDFQAAQICAPSGQTRKDHIIKLDTAKEMAMLERNEKGKQVRRYFIEVEKKYKEVREAFIRSESYPKQDVESTTSLDACLEAAKIMASIPDSQRYVVNILRHCFPDIDAGASHAQEDKVPVDAPEKEKPIRQDITKGVEIHGDNLAMRMEFLGLTNKSLAEQIGVDPSVISKWKSGGKPLRENFILLCQALKCEPSYLRVRKRNGRRIKQQF